MAPIGRSWQIPSFEIATSEVAEPPTAWRRRDCVFWYGVFLPGVVVGCRKTIKKVWVEWISRPWHHVVFSCFKHFACLFWLNLQHRYWADRMDSDVNRCIEYWNDSIAIFPGVCMQGRPTISDGDGIGGIPRNGSHRMGSWFHHWNPSSMVVSGSPKRW